PAGVDVAGGELSLDVGEADLDELDRARVSASRLDGGHDGHVAGSAEAVDRDALAGEVLDVGDAGGSRGDNGVDVLALLEAGGVVGEHLDAEVTELCAEGAESLADGELDVAA